jgi:hypothetical protein
MVMTTLINYEFLYVDGSLTLAHTGTVKILSHTSAWSGLSQPRHPAGATNICVRLTRGRRVIEGRGYLRM